jgi:hydroxymethylbilane synthase
VLAALIDPAAMQTTRAERAIASVLQASCQSPVAAYATVDGEELTVTALIAMPDGSEHIRQTMSGKASDAEGIGRQLAADLLQQGAREMLDKAEAMSG